jgi:hypothetical protein
MQAALVALSIANEAGATKTRKIPSLCHTIYYIHPNYVIIHILVAGIKKVRIESQSSYLKVSLGNKGADGDQLRIMLDDAVVALEDVEWIQQSKEI